MRPKVPWTKPMLEKFIEEALLSEDEERVLRTRIAGWSIVKQSMEMCVSTATISRIVNQIKSKYKAIQPLYPDIFPPMKQTKFEDILDSTEQDAQAKCDHLISEFETQCGKDLRKMTMEQIIICQKNCPYNTFYK